MASDDEDEQQAGDDHAGPTSSADEADFVAEEAPQTNWAVHDVARLPDGGFAIITHVEAADVRLERCTGLAAFAAACNGGDGGSNGVGNVSGAFANDAMFDNMSGRRRRRVRLMKENCILLFNSPQ